MTLSLVVLASGRGSNFEALLRAIEAGTCDAQVLALITDNPAAPAIGIARAGGVSVHVVERASFASSILFDEKILSILDSIRPDLVVLAGYMRLLRSPKLLAAYSGRILNIHPSLLPKYPGATAQADAFNAGEKTSGLTLHLVDATLDGGPILFQEKVDISDCKSAEDVSRKILAREHVAYGKLIDDIAHGKYPQVKIPPKGEGAAAAPSDVANAHLISQIFDVHAHHPAAWGRQAVHRFCAAGFSPSSNQDVISAIASCPTGFMALGLGPQEIQRADRYPDLEAAILQVEEQARTVRAHPTLSPKLVAIGEVGLDNHWGKTPQDRQRQFAAFERMIALARELHLPLVIHSRDAEGDCLKQLLAADHLHSSTSASRLRVLMHCFGGSLEQAQTAADAGWLISIPPVPSKERKKIIAALPLSCLVLESDAPYIGKESGLGALKSAEMIAKYRGVPLEEAVQATAQNAQKFFGL